MDKDEKKTKEETKKTGDDNMTTAIIREEVTMKDKRMNLLKAKLNKITAKTQLLTGEDGMIELDPTNPQHKEWFEKDKYREK